MKESDRIKCRFFGNLGGLPWKNGAPRPSDGRDDVPYILVLQGSQASWLYEDGQKVDALHPPWGYAPWTLEEIESEASLADHRIRELSTCPFDLPEETIDSYRYRIRIMNSDSPVRYAFHGRTYTFDSAQKLAESIRVLRPELVFSVELFEGKE